MDSAANQRGLIRAMGVVSARPDNVPMECRELHPNAIQRSDVEETIEPQAFLTRINAHLDAVEGGQARSYCCPDVVPMVQLKLTRATKRRAPIHRKLK